MSYTDGKRYTRLLALTGEQRMLVTSNAVIGALLVGPEPFNVAGACAIVTVANTVTPAVVAIKHRPVPGAATNEVVIGTLTIPVTGSTVGDCIYKHWSPYKVPAGSEIVAEVTTAGTLGAVAINLELIDTTDAPGNNVRMKASV
jgi:hypothetical protein